MKIVQPSTHIIDEPDPYKKIEKIGRLCYKSEDKITEDSAIPFVNRLKEHGHFAMLEHAYLHFLWNHNYRPITDPFEMFANIPGVIITRAVDDLYLISVNLSHLYNPKWQNCEYMQDLRHWFEYVYFDESGNRQLRLPDNIDIKLLNKLDDAKQTFKEHDPTIDDSAWNKIKTKHTILSIYFMVDRGVSHELVRHRCSVAQSSTRYCNYAKEKFGSEITYIEPSTYAEWTPDVRDRFESYLEDCENLYMYMINSGLQPQQARAILPNALMTEVVLTMSIDRWEHFFDMRSRGITGKPHPDMKFIADKAIELFTEYKNNLIK